MLDRLRARGYVIDTVAAAKWTEIVAERAATGEDPALSIAAAHMHGEPAGGAAQIVFARDNLHPTLPGELLAAARIDHDVLDTYVNHLVDNGFLPEPPAP